MTVGTLAPGNVIANRYRVLRPIAEGGMGAVYEVEHPATGARRALKIMHGEIARDERLRVRFIQEARVGATIQSDHVAKVFDAGVDEATGMLFIVMDLLIGRTLSAEVKRRGCLTLREAHEVMRQTCHALAAAHQMGIVHRDLKPSNIFLSAPQVVGMEFMVRVLDFGIAKVVADAAAGATAIVGTPSWMAPEQTDPHAQVGAATDVWPLGLIAFRMLTGCHFFPSGNIDGAATAAMLRDVVIEPIVPASQRAAQYGAGARWPQALDAWFARCVARDVSWRFPTAGEAYNAFAQVVVPLLGVAPASGGTHPSIGTVGSLQAQSQPASWSGGGGGAERGTAVETAAPWSGRPPSHDVSRPGSNAFTTAETAAPPPKPRPSRAPWLVVGGLLVAGGIAAGVFVATRPSGTTPSASASGVTSAEPPSSASAASAVPVATSAGVVLRLHGSNTIGEDLGPALIDAFLRRRAGVSGVSRVPVAEAEVNLEAHPQGAPAQVVEVKSHGSNTGFEDLDTGVADVAMASRRITHEEAKKLERLGDMMSAACEHVVALDGIAIIVNPANPLVKVSRGDLTKILAGDLARWSGVGGRDTPIALYARDDRSGTTDVIKALLLGGKPVAPAATRFESNDKLSDAVAAEANAIGYVGLSAVRSSKAVMIDDKGAVPLLPSPHTLAAEDYALTRRLYLYTPARPSDAARAFVDFALSDEGQRIVAQTGFVDLRPQCEPRTSPCDTCPRDYKEVVAGACRISSTFRFNGGGGQPDTRGLRDLTRIASLLQKPELASKGIVLVGFADAEGGAAGAVARSKAYADAIADQLRARGLRVQAVKGLGAAVPLADDATDGGRERNRRVEMWLK